MSFAKPTAHIGFLAIEAWGHTRPLCALTSRLLEERPVFITFVTTPNFVGRIEAELSRSLSPEHKQYRDLVRIVALKLPAGSPVDLEVMKAFNESFSDLYGKIANEQPVICASTGKEVKGILPPDVFIMDCFCTPALEAVRRLSQKPVKVHAWISFQAAHLLHMSAPVSGGGKGELIPRILEEASKTGEPVEQIAEKLVYETTGKVLNIASLPPMYDYEMYPQESPYKGIFGPVFMMINSFFRQCDGLVLATPEPYEPEAVAETIAWFAESQREVYTLGPLLPLGLDTAAGEQKQSDASAEIAQFMQKTLQTWGPRSLLHISFGSVWWSMQPEKIWAFLEVVIAKDIPFIMSLASPFAIVPDEISSKVKAYGKGVLSKWSPQQTILAHPVTGWFLTHAGQNSVIESIALGVPMICWPFSADQPTNTARLTNMLDVAYELLEVRTEPHGLKPLHRTGKAPVGTVDAVRNEAHSILDKAFGEDGERKRANLKRLQEAILSTYDEDGSARRDLKRFMASLP